MNNPVNNNSGGRFPQPPGHREDGAAMRKPTRLLSGLLTLLLFSGCATVSARRQSCLAEMQAHGVDASLQAKVQNGGALDIGDLEQLAQKAVPDRVTIDYVRLTRAAYTLNPKDIDHMRANKVSEAVISFVLGTHSLLPPTQALRNERDRKVEGIDYAGERGTVAAAALPLPDSCSP